MLKIRELVLENPIICAPMAAVTNLAYRQILLRYQPGLYFNEMVSDQAVNYRNTKTLDMLKSLPQEHPIAFQLFGSQIQQMVKAAQYLDQDTDCDVIDLNMGCPVNKVVKTGAGSSLMKDIEYAAQLAYEVRQAIKKPLTVKMRSGWDKQSINAPQLAKLLEQAGVDAVSVHGRTRSQMYEGEVDLSVIKAVKQAVNIPVFGNGDVTSGVLARQMLEETGCDGVMLGRGLLGSPWLISECKAVLSQDDVVTVSLSERLDLLLDHALLLIELFGEETAMKQMRSHAAWGFKGLAHSHKVKTELVVMKTLADFVRIIDEYKGSLNDE